jgi:hypothetical protein
MSTATAKTSTTTATRLAQYALAAAALPAAAASGSVVSETFQIPLTVSDNNSLSIDFGPQFGSVFNFTFRRYTQVNVSYNGGYYLRSVANALINFNNPYYYNFGGTEPVYSASFANYDFINPGPYGGNDPIRFGAGRANSYGASLYFNDFDFYRSDDHDLFNKYFYFGVSSSGDYDLYSGTYGYWQQNQRGFLLFQFFTSGGTHFGYFDLSIAPNGESLRIHGWAFNSLPGGAISTIALPSPGTVGLGALAMGAAGIRRQRRDRTPA